MHPISNSSSFSNEAKPPHNQISTMSYGHVAVINPDPKVKYSEDKVFEIMQTAIKDCPSLCEWSTFTTPLGQPLRTAIYHLGCDNGFHVSFKNYKPSETVINLPNRPSVVFPRPASTRVTFSVNTKQLGPTTQPNGVITGRMCFDEYKQSLRKSFESIKQTFDNDSSVQEIRRKLYKKDEELIVGIASETLGWRSFQILTVEEDNEHFLICKRRQ
ncbi:MAG: hypothetical protein H7A37_05610 [Chlamydiales bacterium]|nr:hypothetical protein [Chlamydiia bacterium]MCP5507757.1 hypothetical protein [Chlamydiales bacterium]